MRRPRNSYEIDEIRKLKLIRSSEMFLSGSSPSGSIRVAFIYPNSYRLMCSNLGYNRIYQIMLEKGLNVHRFFYDSNFRRFRSLDSYTPLDEFELLFFSVSYELDWFNIIDILMKLKIPILGDERRNHLIFVGGSLPTINSDLFQPLADVIFHGEAEEELPKVLDVLKESIGVEEKKEGIILKLGKMNLRTVSIPSLNITAMESGIYRNVLNDPAHSIFTSRFCEFKNRFLVETGRGCFRKCKFCVISGKFGFFRPVRVEALKRVLDTIPKGLNVGLVAPSVNDHPRISDILDILERRKIGFSVSSLRIDGLNEKLLLGLLRSGQKTLTVAPETGSEELRHRIGKDISDEVIHEKLKLANRVGFRKLKMYFMVGLPGEKLEDVEEIPKLVGKIMDIGFDEVIISLNPFIPKPGTDFENERMEDEKSLREKITILRKNLSKISSKLSGESIRESKLQHILDFITKDDVRGFLEELDKKSKNETTPMSIRRKFLAHVM